MTLIGISGGDAKSKGKFIRKHELSVLLLSDSDFSVARSFACYGEKKFMGKTFDGIIRTTFVLGEQKQVLAVLSDMKPEAHVEAALRFIEQQKSNISSPAAKASGS